MSPQGTSAAFRSIPRSALRDYWVIYSDNLAAVRAETLRVVTLMEELAPILAASTAEEQEAQAARSLALMKAALLEDAWEPYVENLHQQGALFAQMDLSYSVWNAILRAFKSVLVPNLVRAYVEEPARLGAALLAMSEVTDLGMSIIAQEYLNTRQRRIENEHALAVVGSEKLAVSERALRDQTSVLESVLEGMGDAVAVVDTQGRFLVYNRMAREMMGPAPETFFEWKKDIDVQSIETQRGINHKSSPMGCALQGLSTDDQEMIISPTDLPQVVVSVTARPLWDEDGKVRGGVSVLRNITERKRTEEMRRINDQLREESHVLAEASRLKSEFLASMSHELRTPLNAILGFSEMLIDSTSDPVTDQQREYLQDILGGGRHLLHLINDVLDLSKVEAGMMEFSPEPVDLLSLTTEVRDILRPMSSARNITVDVSVAPMPGPVVLDPAKLKQVLYNYLSNALKFTPMNGQVWVRWTPERDQHIRLEVEDTGIGIRTDDIGRLFVAFQQLDAGSAKVHGGTGLGLALTRRLVAAQQGRIGVRSVLGKGSTFEAVLPRQLEYTAVLGHSEPGRLKPADMPTLLVVEDEPTDQRWLVETLSHAGYAVEVASTGAEAIAACERRRFDGVTLDLLLPDLNGLDVVRTLREYGSNRDTPVIVVTVGAEVNRAAGFPVADVLVKPVDKPHLLQALLRAGIPPGIAAAVLVVDDDPLALKLIEAMLGGLGYRCICCTNGEAALEASIREPLGVVILDLMMPGMDGFELLDRLRLNRAHHHLPVIIWTSKTLTREEVLRLGRSAQAVLPKTSATSTLADLVALTIGPPDALKASGKMPGSAWKGDPPWEAGS